MSDTSPNPVDNARPLNATQTRNLEKLVINDFNQLKAEIEAFAGDQISARSAEIRLGADVAAKQAFQQRSVDLVRTYRRESEALVREAQILGFTIMVPEFRYGTENIQITDKGLQDRLDEARKEIETDRDRALLKLAAQRGKSLREVYQASITAQAEQILDTIPTASQLMAEAAANETRGELA